ncbi:MAG TPA: ABC transporter substrate-binding protein [Anaeromyxobacteraceae bacterium]|nr:ABC transporter substrate-binding protein [Anaeromyxobacteraceae bacterium]
MSRPRALPLAVAAAVLGVALAPAAARGAGLTPLQAAGKKLYVEGQGTGGAEINVLVGNDPAPVPASVLPCASCHGADGQGKPEGAVVPSIITWTELMKPYGHAHPGRSHPAFDRRSLVRAVTEGIDPAGNRLDAAMPRYALSRADGEALLAWLEVLERQGDPGVAPDALRVGTVLPTSGRLAGVGLAMRAALEQAFAEVNASGGINGRRLELACAGYDADRETGLAAARGLLRGKPVFALVSGFAPGAEEEVAALAEAEGVPHVGPFTPFTRPGGARFTFYVSAGLAEQARVLLDYAAARLDLADPPLAVLRAEGKPFAAAAAAALAEARARGFTHVEERSVGAEGPGREAVEALRAAKTEVVLLLGDDRALAGLLRRAEAAGWSPFVLAPGTLVARAAAAAPPAFDGRLLLAYPALPGDESEAGRARLERLAAGKEGERHRAAEASALSAAAVFTEAVKRAGKQLSRAGLVASLEGLYELDTGLGPPVSYGARRRVGALGSYVVVVDLSKRTFRPVSGWMRLE